MGFFIQGNVMAWDQATIDAVWQKGQIRPGQDPDIIRVDDYGNAILRHQYGNRNSAYGWEIDHILRLENGGTDSLSNLRPLQWRVNAARQ